MTKLIYNEKEAIIVGHLPLQILLYIVIYTLFLKIEYLIS